MDAVELLYDHYTDSVTLMKDAQRDRDRFFIVVCALLAVLFILGTNPTEAISAIQQLAENQWGIKTAFGFDVLQSLIWILLLYYTIRYFQRNIYSEQITTYIHSLEKSISKLAQIEFDREGADYLKEYPKVLDAIYWIYTLVFPVIYLALIVYKLYCECSSNPSLVNGAVALSDAIIICLYLGFLHKDKFVTKKPASESSQNLTTKAGE